ncbi:uncharacterized protein LOC117124961, partial [Anneissia japonica]|uniref:uncharacterized protein LOC117124961 n=1 Tax=Anneissia japonica TaxID=1529436 RepID=UPI001425B240
MKNISFKASSRVRRKFKTPGQLIRNSSKEIFLSLPLSIYPKKQEVSGGGDLMQYGSVMGDPAYRMNLAKFLSEEYEDNVDWNTLMSTSGATAGLSLLASTFFNPGNYIFIEDPTFFQVNRIFRTDLGLKVVPIPLDEYGIDLKILEQEIELKKPNNFQPTAEYPFWALMYVIPIYQNPTGLCYSK